MIEFRCAECQKGIGVDEEFAGRLIQCPACQAAVRVPDIVAEAVPVAEQIADSHIESTLPHLPRTSNPTCPSCNSELSNASDAVCGICGHLLEQAPIVNAPLNPRPTAAPASALEATSRGNFEDALPVNPAIGSSKTEPKFVDAAAYKAGSHPRNSSSTSTGKSVGAWFAAVAVGMFLALIWGIVASFMGIGGQVFAVAIGAIVGLLAGLIARNPSIPFCLATTAGALMCMLFGRLVSAWVIMIAVGAMSSVQSLVPDTGVTIGVMEDLNNKGEFEAEEKLLAEMKIDAFFSNKPINDVEAYDEVEYETEIAVDLKVREAVRQLSDEERKAVLERVRQDHPGWMEKEWQYSAILDFMVENEELDDEDLLVHAKSKLVELEGSYDAEYYQSIATVEFEKREKKLDALVAKKFAEMDPQQRGEAIKKARLNHLSWTPVRHEFLAMLDAMYESGDIPNELKKRAKSTINRELSQEYDYSMDQSDEDIDKLQQENVDLQAVVNKELLELEQDEIDQIVASTQKKYPSWDPDTGLDLLDDISDGIAGQIARFESDGTFWSSLMTRFRTLDFVWLALGMISAFAIAFTIGKSGQNRAN